jgi:hypothetical protein
MVLVLALLVGTTAAFGVTEALKVERSSVTRPQFDRLFSPTCLCAQRTARLELRLREADTIDAVIVDADGAPVRTLASESRQAAGRAVFHWDGTSDEGAVVPDGRYRLRIHLDDERRTILIPDVVRVDTRPPAIELLDLAPLLLSPDGDGVNDRARIEFRLSDRARPLLLVDGSPAARGRVRGGTGTLLWPEAADHGRLPPRPYTLALQAEDLAGNVSAPTAGATVRIRYVELARKTVRTRRGGVLRFRVLTDARQYRWALVRRSGSRRPLISGAASATPLSVRLPAQVRRGRYVLRVAASGHSDEATVVVRRRR